LCFSQVHERNLHIDINLALIKLILAKRPNLKLVITSATLDSDQLRAFFSAGVLEVAGHMYDVQEFRLTRDPKFKLVSEGAYSPTTPQPYSTKKNKGKEKLKEPEENDDLHIQFQETWNSEGGGEQISDQLLDDDNECARVAVSACRMIVHCQHKGDILVFLAGQPDVLKAVDMMRYELSQSSCTISGERVVCFPLYGALSQGEQDKVRKSIEALKCDRKIIFATNIAETSVTIDGIKFVVDSGREKVVKLDPRTGWPSLQIQPVTRSSVKQRRGRAGRTSAGWYVPLYSGAFAEQMLPLRPPEICRCDLASPLLDVLCLVKEWLPELEMLDPPPKEAVRRAIDTLTYLEAINEVQGDSIPKPTPKGSQMARLPLSCPQSAAMLIRASKRDLATSEEVAAIAAMLEVGVDRLLKTKDRDRLEEKMCGHRDESGDHITLLNLFLEYRHHKEKKMGERNYIQHWCKRNGIQARVMESAYKVYQQIRQAMKRCNIPILSCPRYLP